MTRWPWSANWMQIVVATSICKTDFRTPYCVPSGRNNYELNIVIDHEVTGIYLRRVS